MVSFDFIRNFISVSLSLRTEEFSKSSHDAAPNTSGTSSLKRNDWGKSENSQLWSFMHAISFRFFLTNFSQNIFLLYYSSERPSRPIFLEKESIQSIRLLARPFFQLSRILQSRDICIKVGVHDYFLSNSTKKNFLNNQVSKNDLENLSFCPLGQLLPFSTGPNLRQRSGECLLSSPKSQAQVKNLWRQEDMCVSRHRHTLSHTYVMNSNHDR